MDTILASRFSRWAAMVINIALFLCMLFLTILIAYILKLNMNAYLLFVTAILMISIQILFICCYRQTIGKKLLHIQVVSANSKAPLGFFHYMLRELAVCIGYSSTILFMIDCVMSFVSQEQRTLTDIIFSTVVIKKN